MDRICNDQCKNRDNHLIIITTKCFRAICKYELHASINNINKNPPST